MKNFKKLLLAVLPLMALAILASCSKKGDETPAGTHKVVFKAETSSDASISTALFTNATGDVTTNTSVNSKTFTSAELTIPSSVMVINFGATGSGASANSSLKVQIWVDGNLVKENIGTGTTLSATTSYTFNK